MEREEKASSQSNPPTRVNFVNQKQSENSKMMQTNGNKTQPQKQPIIKMQPKNIEPVYQQENQASTTGTPLSPSQEVKHSTAINYVRDMSGASQQQNQKNTEEQQKVHISKERLTNKHRNKIHNPTTSSIASRQNQSQVVGSYQLGESIGHGAHGRVYKGIDLHTGQHVAIKQFAMGKFKAEQKHSITMEVDLLKKLDHPNIVKYIDTIQRGYQLCIVLEYVEGGSLETLIKHYGCLTETLVAIYVKQMLQGLDYLHNQGVIHRDIKGANILTTKDGVVKLADFGVATKLTDSERSSNSFAGTPYWVAPEVIEMSGHITSACDIWSLGCTVYELLKGVPPHFEDNQFSAIPAMIKIVKEPMPMPEGISNLLRDFLVQCFTRDPLQRADAKKLLEHPWITKKSDDVGKLTQIMTSSLPLEVTNTIRVHLNEKERTLTSNRQPSSTNQSTVKKRQPSIGDMKVKPLSKPGSEKNSQDSSKDKKQIEERQKSTEASQKVADSKKTQLPTKQVSELSIGTSQISHGQAKQSSQPKLQGVSRLQQMVQATQVEPLKKGHMSATNQANVKALLSHLPGNKIFASGSDKRQNSSKVTKVTLSRPQEKDAEGPGGLSISKSQILASNNLMAQASNRKVKLSSGMNVLPTKAQLKIVKNADQAQQVRIPESDKQHKMFQRSQTQADLVPKAEVCSPPEPSTILQTEENTSYHDQVPQNARGALFDLRGENKKLMFFQKKNSDSGNPSQQPHARKEEEKSRVSSKEHAPMNSITGFKGLKQLQNAVGGKARSRVPPPQININQAQSVSMGVPSTGAGMLQQTQQAVSVKNNQDHLLEKSLNTLSQQHFIPQSRQISTSVSASNKQLKIKQKQVDQKQFEKLQNFVKAKQEINTNIGRNSKDTQDDISPDAIANKPQQVVSQSASHNNQSRLQPKGFFSTIDPQLEQQRRNEATTPLGGTSMFTKQNKPVVASHLVNSASAGGNSFQQLTLQQHIQDTQITCQPQTRLESEPTGLNSVIQSGKPSASHMVPRPASTQPVAAPSNLGQFKNQAHIAVSKNDSQQDLMVLKPQNQVHHQTSTSMMVPHKGGTSLHSPQKSVQGGQSELQTLMFPQARNTGGHTNLLLSRKPQSSVNSNRLSQALSMNVQQHQRLASSQTQGSYQFQFKQAAATPSALLHKSENQNILMHPNKVSTSLEQNMFQVVAGKTIDETSHASLAAFQRGNSTSAGRTISDQTPPPGNSGVTKHQAHKSALATITGQVQAKLTIQTTAQRNRSPTSLLQVEKHPRQNQMCQVRSPDSQFRDVSDCSQMGRVLDGEGTSHFAISTYMGGKGTQVGQSSGQNGTSGLSNHSGQPVMSSVHKMSNQSGLGSNRSDANFVRRQLHDQAIRFALEIKAQVQLLHQMQQEIVSQDEEQKGRDIDQCKSELEAAERKLAALLATVTQLLREYGATQQNNDVDSKSQQFQESLLKEYGYVSLIELLEQPARVSYPVMQLVNQVCEVNPDLQRFLCLAGIIPHLKRFGALHMPRELKVEVAYFIGKVYQTSREVLSMLVASQALQIFVNFLDLDFEDNKDLIMISIDSFLHLFDASHQAPENQQEEACLPLPLPVNEIAMVLGKLGLFEKLSSTIPNLIYQAEASTDLNDQTSIERYLERAFDILFNLARFGPIEVKFKLCTNEVLSQTLCATVSQALQEPTQLTFQVTKWFMRIIQALSNTSETYELLGQQGVTRLLVDILRFYMTIVDHIQLGSIYDALKLLNLLVKMSQERSEQAVLHGGLLEPLHDLIKHIDLTSAQISRNKRSKLIISILNIFHELIGCSSCTRLMMTEFKMHETMLKILKISQSGPSSAPSGRTQSSEGGFSGSKALEHEINSKILDVFVLWILQEETQNQVEIAYETNPVQRFLAQRKSLECIFAVFGSQKSMQVNYIYSSLNKICAHSSTICHSIIFGNIHLVIQLQQQMLGLVTQLQKQSISTEVENQGLKHKLTKSSPNARSVYLQKDLQSQNASDKGPASENQNRETNKKENEAPGGSAQTQKRLSTYTGSQPTTSAKENETQRQVNSSMIQSLKDLMEVCQSLVLTALRSSTQQLNHPALDMNFFPVFVEQTGLIAALEKTVHVLNERNLVILVSLGQNILSLLFEGMQVSAANKSAQAAAAHQAQRDIYQNNLQPPGEMIAQYQQRLQVPQSPDSSSIELNQDESHQKSEKVNPGGNSSGGLFPSYYDEEDLEEDPSGYQNSFNMLGNMPINQHAIAGMMHQQQENSALDMKPLSSSFQDEDGDYFDEIESQSKQLYPEDSAPEFEMKFFQN